MRVAAACHLHSAWSYDGHASLPELRQKLSSRGYRVLLMTEHDRGYDQARFDAFRSACVEASTPETILVPGIEYSDADNRIHVLTWGVGRFLGAERPTLEMLTDVRDENGISVLAHPNRREAWRAFDSAWTPLLRGIEVWNRKYDGWAPSSAAPLVDKATSLIPFVGLDYHTDRQLFPLTMELDLEGELSAGAVEESLRRGQIKALAFGREMLGRQWEGMTASLRWAEAGRRAAARSFREAKRLVRA